MAGEIEAELDGVRSREKKTFRIGIKKNDDKRYNTRKQESKGKGGMC